MKSNLKSDLAIEIALAFRNKWKPIAYAQKYQSSGLVSDGYSGHNAAVREIIFVDSSLDWIEEFNKELKRANTRIEKILDSERRPKNAWLPSFVLDCVRLLPTALPAYSSKPVSIDTAEKFASKLGTELPRIRKGKNFYKISLTGYRYAFNATTRAGSSVRYPLTEWALAAVHKSDIKRVYEEAQFRVSNAFSKVVLPEHKNGELVVSNKRTALYWRRGD